MVLTPNMATLVVANLELQWYIMCNTTISTEFINGNAISVLGILLMVTMPQDELGLTNLYVDCSYNAIKGHDMAPLLLKEMDLWETIQANLQERYKSFSGHVKDVIDGSEYRKLCESSGILAGSNCLSTLLNTDGIPIFKSSSICLASPLMKFLYKGEI